MRRKVALFLLLWASLAPGGLCLAAPSPSEMEDAAKEYRALRKVRGHFQGGEWRDDVDRWGGRKHAVMERLRVGLAHATAGEITRLLGPPDRRSGPGDILWEMARPTRGTHILVYYWRGAHDFLYFACKQDRVVDAAWWMAGE